MSSELQFFLRCKNPDLDSFLGLNLCRPGQYECRLREVRLPGNRLHFLGRKPSRIGKDRQLISFQGPRSKDIHLHKRKSSIAHVNKPIPSTEESQPAGFPTIRMTTEGLRMTSDARPL